MRDRDRRDIGIVNALPTGAVPPREAFKLIKDSFRLVKKDGLFPEPPYVSQSVGVLQAQSVYPNRPGSDGHVLSEDLTADGKPAPRPPGGTEEAPGRFVPTSSPVRCRQKNVRINDGKFSPHVPTTFRLTARRHRTSPPASTRRFREPIR